MDQPYIIATGSDQLSRELRKLLAVIRAATDFNAALGRFSSPQLSLAGNPVTATATITNILTVIGTPPPDPQTYANVSNSFSGAIALALDQLYGGRNPNYNYNSTATSHASSIYKFIRGQVYQAQELSYIKDQILNWSSSFPGDDSSLRDTNDWLLIKQCLTYLQDFKRIDLPQERAAQDTLLAQQIQSYYGGSNSDPFNYGATANEFLQNITTITYLGRWIIACPNDSWGLLAAVAQMETQLDAWRSYVVAQLPRLQYATPLGGDSWQSGCVSCLP
jgi:hypothetical protein